MQDKVNLEFPRVSLLDEVAKIDTVLEKIGVTSKAASISGLAASLEKAEEIERATKHEVVYHAMVDNVSLEEARHIASDVKRSGARYVFAFGGGTPITMGKLTAKFADLLLIVHPTIASTDGINSLNVSVSHGGVPVSIPIETYEIVLTRPWLYRAPWFTKRAGLGDLIVKLSSTRDYRLASDYNRTERGFNDGAATLYEDLALGALKDLHAEVKLQENKRIKNLENNPTHKRHANDLLQRLLRSGNIMNALGTSEGASGFEHFGWHEMPDRSEGLHGEVVYKWMVPNLYLHEKYGIPPSIDWRELVDLGYRVGYLDNGYHSRERDRALVYKFMQMARLNEMRGRYTIALNLKERGKPLTDPRFAKEVLSEVGFIGRPRYII